MEQHSLDTQNMAKAIYDFPVQLKDAFEIGQKFTSSETNSDIRNVVVAGMGGSAIGGDVCKALLINELTVPMVVSRNYTLPNWVNEHTLLICSSYSGNTEETLSAFEDAKAKGAELVEINPANEDFSQQEHHRIPPTIVLDPTDDMQVMQDEIFGPILPVKQYNDLNETLDYINGRDRPLGLYYFGQDKTEEKKVLNNTTSGGVTVNDVIMHIAQEDLPFGGVGPSGMGSYHGIDGFKNFSHSKAIYTQSKTVSKMAAKMMRPPYKKAS